MQDKNGVTPRVGDRIKNYANNWALTITSVESGGVVRYEDDHGKKYTLDPYWSNGNFEIITVGSDAIMIERSELPEVLAGGKLPSEDYSGPLPSDNLARSARYRDEALRKLALAEFYAAEEVRRQNRIVTLQRNLQETLTERNEMLDMATVLVDLGWKRGKND